MKILLASYFFYPSVGGVETFAFLVAREFVRLGHDVKLITGIPSEENDSKFTFKIYRRPSPLKTAKLLKWCDIYLQNSISLKYLLPNIFINKPCVIIFQAPIGQNWLIHNLKYFFLRKYNTVSVSNGIGKLLGKIKYSVIHNTFQPDECKVFNENIKREKHLVFLGRLISDKGVDIVLEALAILNKTDLNVNLTVVGAGQEEENLKKLTETLDLGNQVKFVGKKTGKELVKVLNEHQIMIVPSNYPEAFGIVTLEGIACGCALIVSDSYGLPEAVGKCGLIFKMGNAEDCATKIKKLINNFDLQSDLKKNSEKHLKLHTPRHIATQYLDLFNSILSNKDKGQKN